VPASSELLKEKWKLQKDANTSRDSGLLLKNPAVKCKTGYISVYLYPLAGLVPSYLRSIKFVLGRHFSVV